MNRPLHAVFRFDASAEIGGGHAMRCAALMQVLDEFGWRCSVAARAGTRETTRGIDAHEWLDLEADDEPAAMAKRWPTGVDLLVVDHYDWHRDRDAVCRNWAERILVVDDRCDRARDADIVLDMTPGRTLGAWARLVPTACRVLRGPAYACLDESFPRARSGALDCRADRRPERAFVGLGLTDPAGLTLRALDALQDMEVTVAIGSASPHLSAIRAKVAAMRATALVDASAASLAMAMSRADIAVGAAGGSSWERCCLGLPAVVAVAADNQRTNAAALRSAGAAEIVNEFTPNAIRRLRHDPSRRHAMARRAAALCDGLGARRVALAISQEPKARDGKPVSLRPAVAGDGAAMLAWQHHPGTRRFARNPAVPTPAEHEAWFAARLADPDCLFSIIEHGGEAAGVLRLERRVAAYEVNIYVAPDHLRQGLGSAALGVGRRLVPWAELHAVVLDGNDASHTLFRRAGYTDRGTHYVSPPLPQRTREEIHAAR